MSTQFNLKLEEIRAHVQALEEEYGFHFHDEALLWEALTHPSMAAEDATFPNDNQRLEFLGDAVLQMILTDWLFTELPREHEGVLTRARAVLAREETLAGFSRRLGLDRILLLGHGECMTGGRERPSILCDTFEAFLGALRLDNGYEAARDFCLRLLPASARVMETLGQDENPKGYLQELCQLHHLGNPVYRQVAQDGSAHEPVFVVECCLGGAVCGIGNGHSVREAQKAAARDAIRRRQFLLTTEDGGES